MLRSSVISTLCMHVRQMQGGQSAALVADYSCSMWTDVRLLRRAVLLDADDVGALDKLEGFASHYGADFYGLPRNQDEVLLVRRAQRIEEAFEMGDDVVVPLWAGQMLRFSLEVD